MSEVSADSGFEYNCEHCKSSVNVPSVSGITSVGELNFCPSCGFLTPAAIGNLEHFFRMVQLSRPLFATRQLVLKSELRAAAREALITLESVVRRRADLPRLMGVELMEKAFSFPGDRSNKVLRPRICINNLDNREKENEQEGIKMMARGVMQGLRNLYAHGTGTVRLYFVLEIITIVDFILKQVMSEESVAVCSEHEWKNYSGEPLSQPDAVGGDLET